MKLTKQTILNTLAFVPLPVALYAFFFKCDLLFLFGFQIVWSL
jgi:hypothetical protein